MNLCYNVIILEFTVVQWTEISKDRVVREGLCLWRKNEVSCIGSMLDSEVNEVAEDWGEMNLVSLLHTGHLDWCKSRMNGPSQLLSLCVA
jgi:hypothetical protein